MSVLENVTIAVNNYILMCLSKVCWSLLFYPTSSLSMIETIQKHMNMKLTCWGLIYIQYFICLYQFTWQNTHILGKTTQHKTVKICLLYNYLMMTYYRIFLNAIDLRGKTKPLKRLPQKLSFWMGSSGHLDSQATGMIWATSWVTRL